MKHSLQKINKIAAVNASRALKMMFKGDVELKIPRARVESIVKFKPAIPAEEMTVGVYLPIGGDAKGAALLVLPRESAFVLCDLLFKKKTGSTRKLTRLDRAALKEVGNVICGQYFTVFSNTLGIRVIENVPHLSYSMFGAIISDIIARFARISDKALVCEIDMAFKPTVIKAYFLLLFEPLEITRLVK